METTNTCAYILTFEQGTPPRCGKAATHTSSTGTKGWCGEHSRPCDLPKGGS